jgi:hypothetical protein
MIKILLHILYVKWIKGECRHICDFCKYHNECWDNVMYDFDRKGNK